MVVQSFLRRANGLDRPVYFDRQLLQAEDLSLEQGFGDLRLALLARNCLGWGVAAGLIPRVEGNQSSPSAALSVSPGYALTPMGREIYLPGEVRFDAVEALVRALCHDMPDCTNVTTVGSSEDRAGTVIAWVIARIAEHEGGLRPAFPEGCGHPGNNSRPSRRCGGTQVEIVCAIASPHSDPLLDAECLRRRICGPWGPELPEDINAERDYVVLGRVEVRREGVFVTPEDRRRIARLDYVGRAGCAAHETRFRFVTHIQRDQEDKDRAIDRLAGVDENGAFWMQSLDEAIAQIERGGVTYATLPSRGGEGATIKVRRRNGKKYLRTDEDARPPNNLLSLPEIASQ